MKHLISYNESIRDKMTPRSKKDVEEAIGDLVPNAKLVKAAENGVTWMVQEALDEGANIHHMNDEAIKIACLKNHVDVVKLLLDNGVDVHLDNDMLIIETSWSVNYEMIKLLLEYGADVNIQGGIVLGSIVELATIINDSLGMKTIKLLLEYGAIPSHYSIDFARAHNRMDIVDLLEKHLTTNESVRDKMTPKSSEDILTTFDNLDILVQKKMFIKLIRDKFKYTDDFYDFAKFTLGISDWRRITKGQPRHTRDFYELIDKLRKHELNKLFKALITKNPINESVKDLMTPKSDDDIKQSLSDVTDENLYGMYIKAIIESDFITLDLLKKHNCDINVRNKEKRTPLMFMCEYEYSSAPMIKALVVKLGANMNLKDRNNRTALMYAVDSDNLQIVKMLLTLGVDLKKYDQGARALIRAVTIAKNYNIVLALVNADVDVNYIDYNHSTALTYATLISERQITRLLLSKGADVNIQNENGMSPLMMAARGNDPEIIKMLLDAGADINLKNNNHQTAADFALAYTKKDNADLIRNYKKVNEGVRDLMTPKSKKEIDEELEEMEPFERMTTIFNQQIDDINMGIKPYYKQEEIDRMIPEYIEITNFIFDLHEKIEHLYYYYNLSVLIRQELKEDLKKLPASDQIQCCHDMEYLGGLYTDQEWAELGKRAKEGKK